VNRIRATGFSPYANFACITLGSVLSAAIMAQAQTQTPATAPESGTAGVPALNTYVLPNRTAGIKLPADWQVVQTGVAFIRAQGPNGELAIFGIVVPAHDSPATAVTQSGVNQAYSADLKDKFTSSMGWVLQRLGKGAVPINIVSNTPFKAPPEFGSCANLTMLLGPNGGIAAEADFCSLPTDSSGNYKNFFKIVGLGSARAKQERPMLEAILSSYRLNIPAIKQQLANAANSAQTAANQGMASQGGGMSGGGMSGGSMQGGALQSQAAALVSVQQQQMAMRLAQAQVNAIQSTTSYMMRSANQNFNNFDHDLRGDTAVYASGSSQPLFWVSN
jgi:hypothetical protein